MASQGTGELNLGLLARGDRRGLAVQTTELARHLNPAKVLGIDMQHLSPYPCDWSDFRQSTLTVVNLAEITTDTLREWLTGIDVLLTAETMYHSFATGVCAQAGVKTVVILNPEFHSHVLAADWAPRPDVIAVPTPWEMNRIPGAVLLPHGVNRDRLPFRRRTEAKTFLFVQGHSAAQDRQGIRIVSEALTHVTEPMRVVIRAQRAVGLSHRPVRCVDLEVIGEDLPHYWSLYEDADVLISPRRYGGQHLPMMEALSTGMPVLVPDASPQNQILPPEMLLNATTWRHIRTTSGEFPMHDVDPRVLAGAMDSLVRNPQVVARLSDAANEIAERQSWPNLLPTYDALFRSLVE